MPIVMQALCVMKYESVKRIAVQNKNIDFKRDVNRVTSAFIERVD